MVFLYECDACKAVYEPVQSAEGTHQEYPCVCGKMAKRVYTKATAPSMKLNAGFHSDELGVDVKNHSDFEMRKEQQRYEQGLNVHLGNNFTPKQEWVDSAARKDVEIDKAAKRHDEESGREYEKHYDSIETFTDTNREE